jgi:hypothetical protein
MQAGKITPIANDAEMRAFAVKRIGEEYVNEFDANLMKLKVALRRGVVADACFLFNSMRPVMSEKDSPMQQMAKREHFAHFVAPTSTLSFLAACTIAKALPPDAEVLEVNALHGLQGRMLQLARCRVQMIHRAATVPDHPICEVHMVGSPVSYLEGSGTRFEALLLAVTSYRDGEEDALRCVEVFKGSIIIYIGHHVDHRNRREARIITLLKRDFEIANTIGAPQGRFLIPAHQVCIFKRRNK